MRLPASLGGSGGTENQCADHPPRRAFERARSSDTCDLLQRLFRGGNHGFGAYLAACRIPHPKVGRNPSYPSHALEFFANISRLLHLLLNLKRDQVADWIVGEIHEGIYQVGIDTEQHYVSDVEDRRIVAVP